MRAVFPTTDPDRDDLFWIPSPVVALVVVGVACLTALTVAAELPGASTSRVVLDVGVGLVACAAVPALLRWPAVVAAGLAVLAAVSPAATPAATLGTLQTARDRPLRQAALVALAGVAGHLVRGAWRPLSGLDTGWWILLVVLAHAALLGWGALARARRDLLVHLWERARRAEREQASRVQEARVAERTRIAREMHDVLAHRLSLLVTTAGAVEYRPDADPGRLVAAAAAVRTEAHRALDDLRGIVQVLRYDDLTAGSDASPAATAPVQGPQPVLADLAGMVRELRDAGLDVRLDERVDQPERVPALLARTVYRIVQEGLTNARRHAPGLPVTVSVTGGVDDGLEIDVVNPLPSEIRATTVGSSTGLIGLAERVDVVGGRLRHGATTDGFTLHAWLPWPA